MRSLRFVARIAMIVVPLAIVGGEVMARLMGVEPYTGDVIEHQWAEDDLELGWVNRPGVALSHEAGNVPMTYWDDGRRASRPDPAGTPGAREVILAGGSWVQGYGIRDDQTFAWVANAGLPHLTIQNYGTGGYGTYQSLLMLERQLAARGDPPALLVHGLATLHGIRNVQTFGWLNSLRNSAGQRLAAPHVVLDGDGLARRPPASLANWPLEGASALVRAFHDSYYRLVLRDREAQVVPATKRILSEMNALAEGHGIPFLAMVTHDTHNPGVYQEYMRDQGITYVECMHPQEIFLSPRLMVGGTGHANEVVHAHWGECLRDWLSENGFSASD